MFVSRMARKSKKNEEALYLGVQLSESMDMTKEINMRIRSTMSTWKALGECWKHGNVSLRKKKFQVYGAVIRSKLLYGCGNINSKTKSNV